MKKNIFCLVAAAALVTFAGCRKENGPVVSDDEKCELSINLGNSSVVSTKVPGIVADDDIIKDVQVFVFFKDYQGDRLDAALHFPDLSARGYFSPGTKTVSCTRGHREIWVLVNSKTNFIDGNTSDMITDLASLKAKTTLLSDNVYKGTEKHFFMAGNRIVDLNSANETVSIDVKRMASRIVIKKIENRLLMPAHRASLKITGAYIMNVTGIQKFDNLNIEQYTDRSYMDAASIADNYWYGKNIKQTGELFCETFASAKSVDYEGAISNVSTFYAYPNDAGASEASTWSKRASVLVICASVSGTDCVYPIQLPALESGKQYEVSLAVKHVGGDPSKPWERIKFDDMVPTVSVKPWLAGGDINETI